jgi:hypothetical protein
MNKILKSKNPIILLLVVLLSGVSLSNVANAIASDAKIITSTTVGTLTGGNITAVPAGTKVDILKAGLVVSTDATVEILAATGGAAVADQATTNVTATMVIEVTAEDLSTAEYTITMAVVESGSGSSPPASFTPSTPQTALVLTTSSATVGWGSQVKLTLTGGSGTGAVTYSSTGATFCAVDRDGNLTPISAGTCSVTANKAADGTYGSAQSNSITIVATEAVNTATTTSSTSNSGVAMVVGKPVGGVATVKFTVADTYAGDRVSVILATKSSTGRTIYKTLGTATVGSTGLVTYKTKVKLPVGAVLQLKSAGTVILSKSIK